MSEVCEECDDMRVAMVLCSLCHGTGELISESCHACGGLGEVLGACPECFKDEEDDSEQDEQQPT